MEESSEEIAQDVQASGKRTFRTLTSTLTVERATARDNGTYRCTARNMVGTAEEEVTVNVLGKFTGTNNLDHKI